MRESSSRNLESRVDQLIERRKNKKKEPSGEVAELITGYFPALVEALRTAPLAFQILALPGVVIACYFVLFLLFAWRFQGDVPDLVEGLLRFYSGPANWYFDLKILGRYMANTLMAVIVSISSYVIFIRPIFILWPRWQELRISRKSKVTIKLEKVAPDSVVGKPQQAARPDEVPELIHRMVTRFIDIQTLQPVGILRSVLELLESDIHEYSHLLNNRECLNSLKVLQNLSPGAFSDPHCMEELMMPEFKVRFDRLKLPLNRLAPTLLDRLKLEISDAPKSEQQDFSIPDVLSDDLLNSDNVLSDSGLFDTADPPEL